MTSWALKTIQAIANTTNGDDFNKVVLNARRCISFETDTIEMLNEIHELFRQSEHVLNTLLEHHVNYQHYKWPHQSLFDTLMSYLFFPMQSEYGYGDIISTDHTEVLMAISASYGNTLAQHKMVKILDDYMPIHIDEDGAETEHETPFDDYFGIEAKQHLDRYISKDGDAPCYFGGLLSLESSSNQTYVYYKRGYELKDPFCTFYYAMSLDDDEIKRKISDELTKLHRGLGFMLLASILIDDERIQTYIE